MQCWTGWRPRRRLIWGHFWESMLLANRAEWCGGIIRISWFSKMPSICTLCPKGRMRIYYSSWSWRHILLPLWMDVIEMQDTKAMTIPCPYYKNAFGGQEWPNRWQNLLGPADAASNMRVASPRPHYAPYWLWLPLISCMLIWQALRPCWSQINHLWVANVLVFQDHFMKHVLVYVTPDQTAKTIAKFLYGGYISIFGVPARLLSDWGASFTSSVIGEMCKILGIKWLQTTPYHPQTNGLVERSYQTIMHIFRKLGEDKKADWLSHLVEIAHTYNATWSTVTG